MGASHWKRTSCNLERRFSTKSVIHHLIPQLSFEVRPFSLYLLCSLFILECHHLSGMLIGVK